MQLLFADFFFPQFLTPKLRRAAHTWAQPLVKYTAFYNLANCTGKNLIVQQTCNMQYVRILCYFRVHTWTFDAAFSIAFCVIHLNSLAKALLSMILALAIDIRKGNFMLNSVLCMRLFIDHKLIQLSYFIVCEHWIKHTVVPIVYSHKCASLRYNFKICAGI